MGEGVLMFSLIYPSPVRRRRAIRQEADSIVSSLKKTPPKHTNKQHKEVNQCKAAKSDSACSRERFTTSNLFQNALRCCSENNFKTLVWGVTVSLPLSGNTQGNVHARTHTHTHAHTHTHTHTCAHTHMCTHTHTCAHTHTRARARARARAHSMPVWMLVS